MLFPQELSPSAALRCANANQRHTSQSRIPSPAANTQRRSVSSLHCHTAAGPAPSPSQMVPSTKAFVQGVQLFSSALYQGAQISTTNNELLSAHLDCALQPVTLKHRGLLHTIYMALTQYSEHAVDEGKGSCTGACLLGACAACVLVCVVRGCRGKV
jgi:hypothetical protein